MCNYSGQLLLVSGAALKEEKKGANGEGGWGTKGTAITTADLVTLLRPPKT